MRDGKDTTSIGSDHTSDVMRENAYLREVIQQLRGLANENLALLQRIADLESGSVTKPVTRLAVQAGQAKQAPQSVDAPAETVSLSSRIVPAAAGRLPVLIIGPDAVDANAWASFGLPELTDVCFGMIAEAALGFLCGPLADVQLRQFDPLRRGYELQVIDNRTTGSPAAWSEVVATAIDAYRPVVTIISHFSPGWEQAVAAARQIRSSVVLLCTKNEPNLLAGHDAGPWPASRFDAEIVRQVDLVLVTSHWEQEVVQEVCGPDTKVELYVRGVDLTKFGFARREARAETNVLFVFDRAGSVGLRRYLQVAEHLKHTPQVKFSLIADMALPPLVNVVQQQMPKRDGRVALLQQSDIVVIPDECHGFSQSMMEAMASACTVLVPLNGFGGYTETSGMISSGETMEQLAQGILALHGDKDKLAKSQEAAATFARNAFARSNWSGWLQRHINTLV